GPIAHLDDDKQKDQLRKYVDKHELKGKDDVEDFWPYTALVTKVDAKEQTVSIEVGSKVKGIIPLAGMRWARKIDPSVMWEYHKIEDVKGVVKPGDVVMAVPVHDRKVFFDKAMGMGPEGFKAMPPEDDERLLFMLEQDPKVQGALVSMNPHTGYVEAMIGGY